MEGSQAARTEIAVSATPAADSCDKLSDRTAISSEKIGIGLRGRLQLAFGAITLFVVVATGVGLYAFFEVGKSLDRITEKALPPALAAGELSARAEYIVAAGPTLLASNNAHESTRRASSELSAWANAT